MTIRTKIIATTVTSVLATAFVLVGVVWYERGDLRDELTAEFSKQAQHECAAIARDVYMMVRTQHESVKKKLQSDLNVARNIVNNTGDVSLADETVEWDAVNQFTKDMKKTPLPKMMVGNHWLGQNHDSNLASPIVDDIFNLVGGTCTIFQRMNEQGDMLRVSTNVKKLDGSRAIGTYIPAINPDGKPNAIISSILNGETYSGRAYVVNDWYITTYEPIFDRQKKVIGVLYVGVRQESVKELRAGIMDIVVGKTGYVYVLGGKGEQKGDYVISAGGKRDGENIWTAKDADGRLFIQNVINKAVGTENGKCDFEFYPWKNKGETSARRKVVAVTYFEPWDWVIGAGAYEDDFQDAIATVETSIDRLTMRTVIGAVAVCIAFGFLATLIAKKITSGIHLTANTLKDLAQGEGDLTVRFELKEGKTEDEVGRMHRYFNGFVDKIRNVIADIADNARTLAAASTQLAQTAAQLNQSTEETTRKSASVASAAEEMSINMQGMAKGTGEMSANVQTVASAIEEMTASIGEVAKNAEQAAQVAENAAALAQTSNENVGELGTAANEIGKVIETIQDIAEQTNLLALNATIEAARAGDAGKGFAVVANEVKELAKQTAEATDDIRKRIEGIQNTSDQAVTSIGDISKVIEKVNEVSRVIASAVEEQSITTREIAQNVAQTATAAETVSSGVSQSAEAANEITQNITGVDQAARQGSEGASQTQTAGEELSQLGERLRLLVSQFKI